MIFAEIEPKMNASFAVLMLIVALALKAVLPSGIYMVNTFVGASLLIVAVKTPLPSPQSVQSLARISFFVYLVHLIPLSILRGPVAELGMHGVALGVVLTGIAWAASNLTGLICLRLRWGWPIMP
jgi:peptidoglycan/LPS O-acetylase OafA/YrhL